MIDFAKYVVLDNEPSHLVGIRRAFEDIGSVCYGVEYTSERDPDPRPFQQARVIFTDLHLLTNIRGSDNKVHFNEIARLVRIFRKDSLEPFILVVWSEHAGELADLKDFLSTHLADDGPHCIPLAVLSLSKSSYINVDSGETIAGVDISNAILELLSSEPAVAALLLWEHSMVRASAAAFGNVVSLQRAGGGSLPDLLQQIWIAAVGQKGLEAIGPRRAAIQSLLPLLADSVLRAPAMDGETAAWEEVAAAAKSVKLTPAQKAGLHAALHWDTPAAGSESNALAEWGGVGELEANFDWTRLGLESADTAVGRLGELAIGPAWSKHYEFVKFVQVRVDAPCDYSQGKPPSPVVVGGLFKKVGSGSPPPSRSNGWVSPWLALPGHPEVCIAVVTRWLRIEPKPQEVRATSLGRLRESLLTQLIDQIATNMQRPGIAVAH